MVDFLLYIRGGEMIWQRFFLMIIMAVALLGCGEQGALYLPHHQLTQVQRDNMQQQHD